MCISRNAETGSITLSMIAAWLPSGHRNGRGERRLGRGRIRRALAIRRLPNDALVIEITETAPIDLAKAIDRLRGLYDDGIRISIDDFGTGYTSLSILPHLPINELKVDQRFVIAFSTSDADNTIVDAVRQLAHRLGLDVVAEGVEDEGTAVRRSAMGFDALQGYHLSVPLTAAELRIHLRRRITLEA